VPTAYTAVSYDINEASIQVTKATITKNRFLLEWTEDTYFGALNATSTDGVVYEGTFSYLGWPNHPYHARLGRYRGPNGVILFFGEWWEGDDFTQRESWLIQLVPKAK
jgi:hypothetical protein